MARVRETLQQKAGKQIDPKAGVHNPGNYGKKSMPKKRNKSYGKKR